MSYKPRTLFRILEDTNQNELFLPHIQRPFVWEEDQMIRLTVANAASFRPLTSPG